MRSSLAAILFLIVASLGGAGAVAADEPEKEEGPFSRGFGYLGVFQVTDSNTEVRLFSNDLPLGARLNVQKDLGIANSFSVPRASLGWRFGKRHILTASYYDLSRDGVKRLDRTIELPGDIELDVGIEVATSFTFRVTKLAYTYLFHLDEKVSLGVGAGLFVSTLGAGFTVTGNVGPIQQTTEVFNESVTAPLPVFGFRITYKITRKWGVLNVWDWFFLSYGNQFQGVLGDIQLYAAHRTFKHVGFAGGINIQTTNIEFEDGDLLWQMDARLVGVLGVVTFYF